MSFDYNRLNNIKKNKNYYSIDLDAYKQDYEQKKIAQQQQQAIDNASTWDKIRWATEKFVSGGQSSVLDTLGAIPQSLAVGYNRGAEQSKQEQTTEDKVANTVKNIIKLGARDPVSRLLYNATIGFNDLVNDTTKVAEQTAINIDKADNPLGKIGAFLGGTSSFALQQANPVAQEIYNQGQFQGQIQGKDKAEEVRDKLLKFDEDIHKENDKWTEELAKEGENYDDITKFIGGGAETIGRMTPMIALTYLSGGAGASSGVAQTIGLGQMGLSAKGGATRQALKEGLDLEDADRKGIAKADVEVGTELMWGGLNAFKAFKKSGFEDTARKWLKTSIEKEITSKLGKKTALSAGNWLLNVAGESIEELSSDIYDTWLDNATTDPNKQYTLEDAKNTILNTVFTTTGLNLIDSGVNKVTNAVSNANTQNALTKSVKNGLNETLNTQNTQQVDKQAQQEGYKNNNQKVYLESARANNVNVEDPSVQTMQQFTEKRGLQAIWNADVFKDSSEEAKIDSKNRTVYINPANHETALQKVITHEMFHDTIGAKPHNKLTTLVMDKLAQDPNYEAYRQSVANAYSEQLQGLNEKQANDLINEEMTAKYLGENLGNQEFVTELIDSTDRSTIEKVIDWIDNRIEQIKNIVTGNKEAEYWRSVRENIVKAYNSKYQGAEGVRFSKDIDSIKDSQGRPIDTNIHTYSTDAYSGQVNMVKEYQDQDGNSIARVLYNYFDGEINVDLIETNPEYRRQGLATRLIEDLQNDAKEEGMKINYGYTSKDGTALLNSLENNQKENTTNTQTTTDNQGRKLSEKQQEYFKDSKVRDSNGNLQVMYHGTNSDFTVFDRSKGGQSNAGASVGFWFTETKKGAENFANDSWYGDNRPNAKEVYLDIKNPKIYENVENETQKQAYRQEYENLEKEAKDLRKEYSWDKTDYKTTMTFDTLIRDYQTAERTNEKVDLDLFRGLAKERGFSNEQISDMERDAKKYIELIRKSKEAGNNYDKLRYSDAYEQFKIDLYEMAGQSAEDANIGGLGMSLNSPKETIEKYRNKLIEDGYDGIIIKNTRFDNSNFGGENNQYVAFYPNQIKSVDNTNPTENPDIRYSKKSDAYDNYLKETSINTDNQGNEINPAMQKHMKDSKVRDENGRPILVYNTMTQRGSQFNEYNPVGTPGYRFGNQVVMYTTDSQEMSGSYANGKYKTADTTKISSDKEAQQFIEEYNKTADTLNKYELVKKENGEYELNYITDPELKKFIDNLTYYEKEEMKENVWHDEDFAGTPYEYSFQWNRFNPELLKKYKAITDKYLGRGKIAEAQNAILNGIYYLDNYKRYSNSEEMYKNLKTDIYSKDNSSYESGNSFQYAGYMDIRNPYVIDAKGENWNTVQYMDTKTSEGLIKLDQKSKDNLVKLAEKSKKLHYEAKEERDNIRNLLFQADSEMGIDHTTNTFIREMLNENAFREVKEFLKQKDLKSESRNHWRANNDILEIMEKAGMIDNSSRYYMDWKLSQKAMNYLYQKLQQEIKYPVYSQEPNKVIGTLEGAIDSYIKAIDNFEKYKESDTYFKNELRKNEAKYKDISNDYINAMEESYIGYDKTYNSEKAKILFNSAENNFNEEQIRKQYAKGRATNDIVFDAMNINNKLIGNMDGHTAEEIRKAGGYDGVIIKNTVDYGGYSENPAPHDLYIAFDSSQFKYADNENPTNSKDFRYNKQAKTFDEYLEQHSINKGTVTKIKDVLLPVREKTETKLPVNEEVVKKNTASKNNIVENAKEFFNEDINKSLTPDMFEGISEADLKEGLKQVYQTQLEDELKTGNYKEDSSRKRTYMQYKNNLTEYDKAILESALERVKTNRNGRRTVNQWLDVAKQIGQNAGNLDAKQIQDLAYGSWFDLKPNTKESITRYDNVAKANLPFQKFTSDEWVNTIYDNAKQAKLNTFEEALNKQPVIQQVEETPAKVVENTKGEPINWTEIERPEDNKKFRKHYRSIIESSNTTAEAKAVAKEIMGLDTYIPDSNKAQLERADNMITQLGADETLNSLKLKVLNNDKITPTDIAIGERLIEYYSKTGSRENLQEAIYNTALMGTQAGQTVQALAILNHQTPVGQVTWIQRSIDKANAELQEKYGKKGKEAPQFEFTSEMQDKILNTETKEEMYKAIDEVYEELGKQIPKTTLEQLDEWRYFSMLANVKTHGRNIIGNVFMHGIQRAKDRIAGGIEDVVAKYNPDMERMHTLKKVSQETKDFAKQDLQNMDVQTMLGMNENKYNPQSRLQGARITFKSDILNKTLGKAFDLNSRALEVEDNVGLKAMYTKALGEYLTANNIDVNNITDAELAKARNYAVQASKEATFHQASSLATMLNQMGRTSNIKKFFADALIPFKKTPINVAKTGIQYSPVGLVKSAVYDLPKLRKGQITVNQYIDNVSRGLTGTGIVFVGYALAEAGILKASGGDDDKKEKYDEEQGKQSYSIQIGDNTYSLDWLAPAGIPLFIGAEINQQFNETKEDNTEGNESELDKIVHRVANVVNASANAMNPMSEMSMIQGLTNALSSYNQENAWGNVLVNAGKSYINQYVPTLLGQVARTTDDYERTTKSTKTGVVEKAVDQTINQIKSKIPVLRQTLPIKTDIWGQDVKQSENLPLRAFNNFINPSTVKEVSNDKVNQAINELYDKTGESSILPSVIDKTFTIDGTKYRMTNEEYAKYVKDYGTNAYKLLDNLTSSSDFKKLNDTQKTKAIEEVYAYAKEKNKIDYAKNNKIDGVKPSTDYKVLEELGDKTATAYLSYKGKTSGMTKDKEKLQVLADSDYTGLQKRKIYEYSIGKEDELFKYASELNVDEYLKYKLADIQGTKNQYGETISGSKKEAVLDYVNNNISGYNNRLWIIGQDYKLSRKQQEDLARYINQSDEAIEIFKLFKNNFKVDSNGKVYYK